MSTLQNGVKIINEEPVVTKDNANMQMSAPPLDGAIIDECKENTDNDPNNLPYDAIQVYEYEGLGSRPGSLSSLDDSVASRDQDYDYLNEWGPKFNKIANVYGN